MADLPLSALTDDEKLIVARLERSIRTDEPRLGLMEQYRDAEQRVQHIGMAVPPELRIFEATINVPGMAVREVVSRQELRGFVRTGEGEKPDASLTEAREYNNLDSQQILAHKDCRTFGRAFVSVSTNEEDAEHPLICVEPTRGMGVLVDRRHRRLSAALRTFADDERKRHGTLYLPDSTIKLSRGRNGWQVTERDDHGLGKLALVMMLNSPSAGDFSGRSEMADIISKVDAISRTLTNMQVAAEIAAIPSNVIFGVSEDDFTDRDGKPIPTWEAYWTKLKAITNEKGHVEQLTAADLKNFTVMVDRMLVWCAIELGLPTRYAGMDTTNPASEGAVVADEFRLIKRVETANALDGDAWAWVMSLYEEIRTGEPQPRNGIRALWHNPATPTYSQRADAVMKLRSQKLLSVQGAWDELGWSEERKARELQYLQAEANDPLLSMAADLLNGSTGVAASVG